MTYVGMHVLSDDPQILQKRLAAFVKRQGSAKELAALAQCDVRTAENMRRGISWPNARHFLGLWIAFGDDLTEALLHPERAERRLQREGADLERQLEARRAALRETASFVPRSPQADRRHEDGAAVTPRSSLGGQP